MQAKPEFNPRAGIRGRDRFQQNASAGSRIRCHSGAAPARSRTLGSRRGSSRSGANSALRHLLETTSPSGVILPGQVGIIAAHPDDEAIGVGGHLASLADPWVFYATDGAPTHVAFSAAAGFRTAGEYAAARRAEAQAALGLAGIHRIREGGLKDQEASFHLLELVESLCDTFRELAPSVVLTHPYEGGHPDHDATAFAVRAAARILARKGEAAPAIVEFTSYHNSAAGMAVSDFIRREEAESVSVSLRENQRALKRRMFQAYRTQEAVLKAFPIAIERFRRAPLYDFTEPPHAGTLYYEKFEWGIHGREWRTLAAKALGRLGRALEPGC